MDELLKLKQAQIEALQVENARIKNLLEDAKALLNEIVNEIEVHDEEVYLNHIEALKRSNSNDMVLGGEVRRFLNEKS